MGVSNAQKGAYYKSRTKKWLEARGWQVADLEVVRMVYAPGRAPFAVKRDQFASDLLALRGDTVAFIQVKGGAMCAGHGQFPKARAAFSAFTFPSTVKLFIVAWAPRSRAPRIISVDAQPEDADTYIARRKAEHAHGQA